MLGVGARMFGYSGRVLGISIEHKAQDMRERVATLAGDTAGELGDNEIFLEGEILVNDSYLGAGYGVMGEPEAEALKLFARYEGLLLDPVYTARAAAGLIDLIRNGFFHADQIVFMRDCLSARCLFANPYWETLVPE